MPLLANQRKNPVLESFEYLIDLVGFLAIKNSRVSEAQGPLWVESRNSVDRQPDSGIRGSLVPEAD